MGKHEQIYVIRKRAPKIYIRLCIGGYCGPSYSLEGGTYSLRYRPFSSRYKQADEIQIIPSEEDWTVFFKAIEKNGVWDWQPK